MSMLAPRTILAGLAVTVAIGAFAHAQHGRPSVSAPDDARSSPNPWVALLIEAISVGTGVENWRRKEAMRLRLELDLDPQLDAVDEEGKGRNTGESLRGLITYDLQERRCRLDLESGLTILVERGGLALWRRDSDAPAVARQDVADEVIDAARATYHLLILPLWISDEGGTFGPGGLRSVGDELLYSSALILREAPPQDDEGDGGRASSDDWYAFYSRTSQPHRIDAAAYLVHDRLRRSAEFPRPRLVYFDEFKEVDGVAIAHSWRIHRFSRVDGVGERIGGAKVKGVEFVTRLDEVFDVPAGALRIR